MLCLDSNKKTRFVKPNVYHIVNFWIIVKGMEAQEQLLHCELQTNDLEDVWARHDSINIP